MKKIFLLIPVMILALSGCNTNQSQSNKEVYDVKWVTPVGAPTLAFYDQGMVLEDLTGLVFLESGCTSQRSSLC